MKVGHLCPLEMIPSWIALRPSSDVWNSDFVLGEPAEADRQTNSNDTKGDAMTIILTTNLDDKPWRPTLTTALDLDNFEMFQIFAKSLSNFENMNDWLRSLSNMNPRDASASENGKKGNITQQKWESMPLQDFQCSVNANKIQTLQFNLFAPNEGQVQNLPVPTSRGALHCPHGN